ncbi:hypothetical protein [Campylobacter geochelonis]|uniref:hypothetical protein n=1 Tax=Campylobacter geochelonis TaxID=1780362 RepID=UPI0007709A17|nr:hypothetical protein [Campylobacter geochelonis]CZE47290.1 DsbB family disulfide bond formation protein [Campylobacter geochelonis]
MKKILNLMFVSAVVAFGMEFNLNSNDGAVANTTPLKQVDSFELKLNDTTPITGLDYDEASKTFLLSDLKLGFYTMDESLKNVKTYAKSTKDWIIQMEDGVSASFFNGSLGVMSYNKTYEFFKHVPNQSEEDANKAWRYLPVGFENFTLDFKDRYYTIRAKQQYILSWDYSDFYSEFFTASVPDNIKPYWSIASFSDSDNMLSSEFIPSFDESLGVKDKRDISDYYITGMDANGEFVYLLSKQYSSILKLDPRTRKVVEVYTFSGLTNPRALAMKDGKFYIVSRENGINKIAIFEK